MQDIVERMERMCGTDVESLIPFDDVGKEMNRNEINTDDLLVLDHRNSSRGHGGVMTGTPPKKDGM